MQMKPARRIVSPLTLLGAVAVGVLLMGCGAKEEKATAPEWIRKAWDSFAIGEFALASGKFARAEGQTDATPELKAEALYGQGQAAILGDFLGITENPEEVATRLFNQAIAVAPKSDWAGWSLMALARIKHRAAAKIGSQADWDSVRKAYQDVIDRFPATPEDYEAFVMQQGTLLVTGKMDDAKKVLDAVNARMNANPTPGLMLSCLNLQAECYNTLGDGPHEVEARIKSLEARKAQTIGEFDKSGSYWSIATRSEFECGDFATARDYYKRLIAEYPSDARVIGARLALARMDKLEEELRQQIATQPSVSAGIHTTEAMK